MNCEKNKELLQMYHDCELDKSDEMALFRHLSECEECRLYYRSLMLISANINKSEFPKELDSQIFNAIKRKEITTPGRLYRKAYIKAFSYAAALFFFLLSVFFYHQLSDYKEIMSNINQQLKTQSQTIELLYNTLPPVVTPAKFEHNIIIKPKI